MEFANGYVLFLCCGANVRRPFQLTIIIAIRIFSKLTFASCKLLVRILSSISRKIIAPTISLQTGKIVYDWYLSLDDCNIPSSSSNTNPVNNNRSNSSIRAHVDPTKGIRVIWTDGMPGRINQGARGSCWVTDVRIPLGVVASGRGILGAADIRVGRRWVL